MIFFNFNFTKKTILFIAISFNSIANCLSTDTEEDKSSYKLINLIEKNETEAAKTLILSKKINLNVQDNHGKTALIMAAHKNNEEIIRMLVDKDVKLDIHDEYGRTALSLLLFQNNNLEISEFLIKAGANLNIIDKFSYDRTQLIMTAVRAHNTKDPIYKKKIMLLLKFNADTTIKDREGNTFLDYINDDREFTTEVIECIKNNKKRIKSKLIDHIQDVLCNVVLDYIF